jgi:hypothetical protein
LMAKRILTALTPAVADAEINAGRSADIL